MTTKFETLPEQDKVLTAYNLAFTHAQNFLFNPAHQLPELEQYKNELRSILDWLKPKIGLDGARVY